MSKVRKAPSRRVFEVVDLEHSIWGYGEEVDQLRIYKPKMGDIRALDLDLSGAGADVDLSIDDIMTLLERLGFDADGDPIKDGWVDEIDPDDLGPIGEALGKLLGGSTPTGNDDA